MLAESVDNLRDAFNLEVIGDVLHEAVLSVEFGSLGTVMPE